VRIQPLCANLLVAGGYCEQQTLLSSTLAGLYTALTALCTVSSLHSHFDPQWAQVPTPWWATGGVAADRGVIQAILRMVSHFVWCISQIPTINALRSCVCAALGRSSRSNCIPLHYSSHRLGLCIALRCRGTMTKPLPAKSSRKPSAASGKRCVSHSILPTDPAPPLATSLELQPRHARICTFSGYQLIESFAVCVQCTQEHRQPAGVWAAVRCSERR